ncbi:MAG: sulfotransferase [Rubricoccaceae bacterium]|nr:sulfotransferase [Rubricoccaceae bacterium]
MSVRPAPSSPTASETAPRPTFLVVGVAKAGTTALYHYLGEHPEVYVSPKKEPGFFVPDYGVERWEDYLALFAEAGDAKAIGEATPRYFHNAEAPAKIAEALPGVRIVVLLRQPVDRARSHYVMLTNNGATLQPEPFASFFRRHLPEAARWHEGSLGMRSLALSFYADSLERWLDTFGPDRVAVYLDEDLRRAPEQTMADLYAFLGVDPAFCPDLSKRYNVGRQLPRSGAIQRLIFKGSPLKRLARRLLPEPLRRRGVSAVLQLNQSRQAPLTPEERRAFTEVYRSDLQRVERLIGRDLSDWYD